MSKRDYLPAGFILAPAVEFRPPSTADLPFGLPIEDKASPSRERPPEVVIELPGVPQGKGAGRAVILKPNPLKGRFEAKAALFEDAKTRSYEAMLRFAGQQAMGDRRLFDCPLMCRVTAVFPVPPSWPQYKRKEALAGLLPHAVKPDDDNLIKTRDGLKNVVWTDDSRICVSLVRKLYGEKPFLRIEVWKWMPTLV